MTDSPKQSYDTKLPAAPVVFCEHPMMNPFLLQIQIADAQRRLREELQKAKDVSAASDS